MEWRAIETAPKGQDNEILVARFDGDGSNWYATAMWWIDTWAFFAANPRQVQAPVLLCFEPTHWMPFPAPPK